MERSRPLQIVRSDLVLSWEIKHVVSWVTRHVQDAQELGYYHHLVMLYCLGALLLWQASHIDDFDPQGS